MPVNPAIFREYDIRGKVDEDLGVEVVEDIGRAYATAVRTRGLKRVTCGRDGRTHSLRLQQALVRGMLSAGCDVVDIGECPTPLLYFSIFHLESHGGVQVTGSHNPAEFNGFKMCIETSTLFGPEIRALRDTIESRAFSSGHGSGGEYGIAEPYLEYMRKQITIRRPLKVVIDAGNGVAGPVAVSAFEALGCEVTPLYCDVDGTFPNHHPDPTVPGNLADLVAKVKEKGADFGVAYDGDGDRLGAVDERGEILFGDQLLMIFARDVLKDHPGAAIIGEVKCSQVMYEDIARHGGRPIMWKTGHSLIKKKMRDEKALLAGEMSGHLFFADRYFGYDDGIYASLRLAEIISSGDRPLSAFLGDVPETFSTPEIRMECTDEKKFAVAEEARKWFSERFETIEVDGVRVVFDDGWGLIRASNTQPVLVLRFEASTRERMAEIRGFIEGRLKEIVDGMG
jgi:phosphomannomutase/phosphoglucomutase